MNKNIDPNKGQNNCCELNEKGDRYVECTECGATAEIGTVIKAGDDVYTGQIEAASPEALQELYEKCLKLANSICDELQTQYEDNEAGINRKYTFKFTCTAEKMIYEMRVRNIK